MSRFAAIVLVACLAPAAVAGVEITEWMYNGAGSGSTGEFIEFTNLGAEPVDLTGWSFDDSSRVPGSMMLSALGVLAPGQSAIITDEPTETFATLWGLSTTGILGGNSNNLGRSDEINLFNASGVLADRLTYNDQAVPPQGPRTQLVSCNVPASDYSFDVAQSGWVVAWVGDAYGSWASSRGEIGSPGRIPEPCSLLLLAVAGLLVSRRG